MKPPHSHFVGDERDANALTQMIVTAALASPFLMDELLAFAAAHLGVLSAGTPSKDHYDHLAVHLQTRALALFNAAKPETTEQNCTAMFLFSSFIGMHMLYNTVNAQTDLQHLLEDFVQFAGIYRGVGVVTNLAWHVIRESELSSIIGLIETVDKLNLPHEGSCDHLVTRLMNAEGLLGPSSYKACYDAVESLQWVFKQHRALPDPINLHVVLAWPVRISRDYLELLRNRQPEALVIMAHWAILLYHGRKFWVFDRGGRSLFDAISSFLGPSWSEWLALPREVIYSD